MSYKFWETSLHICLYAEYRDCGVVGEQVQFRKPTGSICTHRYLGESSVIHDFLKEPLSDEEKVLLLLKHGFPLLPKSAFDKLF